MMSSASRSLPKTNAQMGGHGGPPIKEMSTDLDKPSLHSKFTHTDYTVGWVCALPLEQTAATAMLDARHEDLAMEGSDTNSYTLGSIGAHNIVIACLPKGKIGTNSAATVATQMVRTFPSIRVGLMVGIGGGIPPKVRLGDVVISAPVDQYPGVVQWDLGKAQAAGEFQRTGSLNNPPTALLTAVTKLETRHEMEGSKIQEYLEDMEKKWPKLGRDYVRASSLEDHADEVQVHYGLIASGNQVIKDAEFRDSLDKNLGGNVLCVEMEAAGLLNNFPCIVVRGICDYADAQKNKNWQKYAAARAAACAKELLLVVQSADVRREDPAKDILEKVSTGIERIQSRLRGEEDEQILDWLARYDYGSQQTDYFRKCEKGTGTWFLGSAKFEKWLATSQKTLFCPGNPGAGKTFLMSTVINNLTERFREDTRIGIAYIFFDSQRPEEQDVHELLAHLLRQLASCFPILPKEMNDLYKRHKALKTRPSVDELFLALGTVISECSRVFVLVDALDECQSDVCRSMLLSKLFQLQENHKANLLATSRDIPKIVDFFQLEDRLEIEAKAEDVERYLGNHMDELPAFVQCDRKWQQEIQTEISEASRGVFLLAKLYLGLLVDKTTRNEVRNVLKSFHKQPGEPSVDVKTQALAEAYQQTMERIQGQKPGVRILAMRVLLWTTHAKRLLSTEELQHALATRDGEPKLDVGDITDVQIMLNACAGLVTVDAEHSTVRLVHPTTYEFFRRTQQSWFSDADAQITATCIAYLSFEVFESGPCLPDKKFYSRPRSNPFLNYAAMNWGHHAQSAPESLQIIDFLQKESIIAACGEVLMEDITHFTYKNYGQTAPMNVTGLHLAAYFGLYEALETLLSCSDGPDPKDCHGQTPLCYAAGGGHEAVTTLLLSQDGVNPNGGSAHSRTPLCWAISNGNEAIVRLLLANDKTDPNIETKTRTPLLEAIFDGNEAIIRLLPGNDKTFDNLNTNFATHLSWALRNDAEAVDRLLLANDKIDPNFKRSGKSTPLWEAINRGNEAITRLLLANDKTIVNLQINYATYLVWAIRNDDKPIVQLLLASDKTDPNFKTPGKTTPLWDAVREGNEAIVRLLLANDRTNPNLPTIGNETPLWQAINRGNQAIARLLLANVRTDPNVESVGDETPLWQAIYKNDEDAVQLLLADPRTDPNLACRKSKSPLWFGKEQEQKNRALAQSVLEHIGINPDLVCLDGDTPLRLAIFRGNLAILDMLLCSLLSRY